MSPLTKELPPPPPGKRGWPWTKPRATSYEPLSIPWPKISIVTPSYNQEQFLEQTIRSVLLQEYPNLEYIVIDGGSSDRSVEIIKKYADHLAFWISEPDNGQSHAINRGFRIASGALCGWQNSDDYYHCDAFYHAARRWTTADCDVIYGRMYNVDTDGTCLEEYPVNPNIHCRNLAAMLPFLNICNQSTFFSRRIFANGDFVDESFHYAMDYEFYLRLLLKKYIFGFVPEIAAYYRHHSAAKGYTQYATYTREFLRVFRSLYHNAQLPDSLRQKALNCTISLCQDNFGKNHLRLFRESVATLLAMGGGSALSWKLYGKYLLSFLGSATIRQLRKISKKMPDKHH